MLWLALIVGVIGIVALAAWRVRQAVPEVPPVVAPAPDPVPDPLLPTLVIHYVTAKGDLVGVEKIPRKARRVTRTYRGGVYVASHVGASGAWIYRYTQRERQ